MILKKFGALAVLLSLLLSAQPNLQAASRPAPFHLPYPVTRAQLDNGVTVLFVEKHDLPIVSLQTWISVGSSDEQENSEQGLAHLFEHLMFSGTPHTPKQNYDLLVEGSGGAFNAMTTRDYTQYHVNIRSDQLHEILRLEADRMTHFEPTENALARERRVVLEERRGSFEDQLDAQLDASLWETLFRNTSLAHPVIGSRQSIETVTLEQVKKWWSAHYVGRRLILTITGDVFPAKTLPLIKQLYGTLRAGEKRPSQVLAAAQPGTQLKDLPWKTHMSTVRIAVPTVSASHPDTYALDVLSEILHDTRQSRLYEALFHQTHIVQGVNGGHLSGTHYGTLVSHFVLRPGVPTDMALDVYRRAIEELRIKGVRAEELERVRRSTRLAFDRALMSIETLGHLLSLNEMILGDYRRWTGDLPRYLAVTAKDLTRVLNRYVLPERTAIIIGVPESAPVSEGAPL